MDLFGLCIVVSAAFSWITSSFVTILLLNIIRIFRWEDEVRWNDFKWGSINQLFVRLAERTLIKLVMCIDITECCCWQLRAQPCSNKLVSCKLGPVMNAYNCDNLKIRILRSVISVSCYVDVTRIFVPWIWKLILSWLFIYCKVNLSIITLYSMCHLKCILNYSTTVCICKLTHDTHTSLSGHSLLFLHK